ncbi:MAG: hypothetical protein C0436_04930 [Alphaproteobacteria bacterium]|nr:hypothetical protein [Alphaproteobacteria bacterium]
MTQLLLPDGASSARISELMTAPVGESKGLLVEGKEGRVLEIVGVVKLEGVEAAAILEGAEEKKYQPKVDVNAVGTMRIRHHQIARLLAMGHKPAQIARVMDCAAATINNLERSPAFQALLMEYMGMLDKNAVDTVTRMKVLNNLTIDELTNRMTDPGKAQSIKVSELVEVVKATSDRTGLGVTTKSQVQLNGALSVHDIRAIKLSSPTGPSRVFDVVQDYPDAGLCEEPPGDESGAEERFGLRAPDREGVESGDLIEDIVSAVVGIRR